MNIGRLAAFVGCALGVMAANVAITVLYMVVYSYVIDPGHEKAYYDAHVQIAAPYCSIVAGVPLMDLVILAASGPTFRIGVLVAISLLTKLAAVYGGALVARWHAG